MPSFFIYAWRVVRFILTRAVAPVGPPMIQFVALFKRISDECMIARPSQFQHMIPNSFEIAIMIAYRDGAMLIARGGLLTGGWYVRDISWVIC
jgi:hypothetical protein